MIIRFHSNFKKKVKKLKRNEKWKLRERISIFIADEFNPILNNHTLKGKYTGYRSINITGDLRAIYKLVSSNSAIFVDIDSHSNSYR